MRVMPAFVLPMTLCGAMLGGCNGSDEDLPPPTVSLTVTPDSIASGETVTLDVQVEHFTLTPDHGHDHDDLQLDRPLGLRDGAESPRGHDDGETEDRYDGPREGHYHVYLNDLMTNPLLHAYDHRITLVIDAEPGMHELIVRLHAPDHRIIEPQITDSAPLTVVP